MTKYLYEMYLDTTVTKFLDQQEDDIATTKYLGTSSARFLETEEDGIAVTKYLNGPAEFHDKNDISVTKFLDS